MAKRLIQLEPVPVRGGARLATGRLLLLAALSACTGAPFTAGAPAGTEDPGGSGGSGVGAAGAAAQAGSAAESGDPAEAGSGGTEDSAGSANAEGGTVGIAGAPTTAGGAGGSTGLACEHGASTDYELKFYPETQDAVLQDVHPFFEVLNLKGKSVALSRLKIRYYYTKEADGAETGSCFWVTGDRCALIKFAFSDVTPATATANRMMEVSFANASSATLGLAALEVRTGFTVNHANLQQGNDYSFDPKARGPGLAGTFPYTAWDHVTLYVDDQLVWGTEPCPASDSTQPQTQTQ